MWYVYVLKSKDQDWRYIGSTGNLKDYFKDHNLEFGQSTKHYIPFELEAYIAVKTERKARELEKYFKTGSGRAVLHKRILSDEASAQSDPHSLHILCLYFEKRIAWHALLLLLWQRDAVEDRLRQHNAGKVRYTRGRRPLEEA